MNLMGMPLGAMGMFGPKKMVKGGLFGAGGMMMAGGEKKPEAEEKPYLETTSGKLAAIGDLLLRQSGRGGNPLLGYALQQQMMKQRANQQQQLAETQRQAGLQDYEAKKQIDQRYQAPPTPDAFERALLGAGIDPNSPQGRELYAERAQSMAGGQDEFVVVPIPGLGTYAGPKSGLADAMGRPGQVPQAPVGKLTPLGGGAPSGAGMFPRP